MLDCSWREYGSLTCDFCDNFWNSIDVWIKKPHVLNKQIGAVDVFKVGNFDAVSVEKFTKHIKGKIESVTSISLNALISFLTDYQKLDAVNENCNYEVYVRVLYPKTGLFSTDNIDILWKCYDLNRVEFFKAISIPSKILPITSPYLIACEDNSLKIFLPTNSPDCERFSWFQSTLLPKLVGWTKPQLVSTPTYSNRLIASDKYLLTYNKIKEKYFKSLQEIWTESTDPLKFIIEDIAIASYLIVLWEGRIQRYVDLGCGNGLLVHILNCEGHLGYGVDVRARKIWKLYPPTTRLKVETISLSSDYRIGDVDWIIGNHSDELTPWIPVIAGKSDYKTNFFLLPCCLYDFNGNKYARTCTNQTCYEEYLNYIETVCKNCGFIVERDRLKIPSTKRNCFVSRGRIYPENESYCDEINYFVSSRMSDKLSIKIRSDKEKVRNCTQLDKNVISEIVSKIAHYIISTCKESQPWREGEFTDLSDIVELITPEKRALLKNECGGLQTLLKNHHHLFVVRNGRVKLRKPTEKKVSPNVWKNKDCWFYQNHPDSCPLSDEICSYRHIKEGYTVNLT